MVKTWCEHPDYNPTGHFADAVVLMFDQPLKFDEYVWPICLPTSASINEHAPSPGNKCLISGWGKTETERYAQDLQQAVVPVISREDVGYFSILL